jgi:hypothetical protein
MIGVLWMFKVAIRLANAEQESVRIRQAELIPARVKPIHLGRGRYL